MRIGGVSYINALPFFLPFRLGAIKSKAGFFFAPPTTLNRLLREGALDIALTSSVEYLQGGYQCVPGFGIASYGEIFSVNFYTQQPLENLEGARIGLTPESATASTLLRVLCTHYWKVSPHFEILNPHESFENYEGMLLIGDQALSHQSFPGFQTYDLGKVWQELTGLPFIFALFSAGAHLSQKQLQTFADELQQALVWSELHPTLIEQEALKAYPLPQILLRRYFSRLRFHIGDWEHQGLNFFSTLRQSYEISALCS